MKSNKNARKHGHWALKAALKGIDLRAIDRRTVLGSELARRREQILFDTGGRENISELKADLIEKYLRTVVLIDSIDSYLFQQPSLVRRRTRSLYPVVQQRTQLVESALRLAEAIGLDRVKKPAPDLRDYLAEKGQRKADAIKTTAPLIGSKKFPRGPTAQETGGLGEVVVGNRSFPPRKPRLPCERTSCNDPFCDRSHEGDDA